MNERLLIDDSVEQAALGAALASPKALAVIGAKLSPEDFWRPSHRLLWETMARLADEGRAVDHVTVAAELERLGKLEQAGGRSAVFTMAEHVPSIANAGEYARAVADLAALRRLHTAGVAIVERVTHSDDDLPELLDACEQILSEALGKRQSDTLVAAFDAAKALEAELAERRKGRSPSRVMLRCGPLDSLTHGLERGALCILAARPGLGKTSLALQIGLSVAEAGQAVVFYSLEMSAAELTARLAAQRCRIGKQALLSGQLDERQRQRFADLLSLLLKSRYWLDDAASLSVTELRRRCRTLAMRGEPLDLVIVDYVQLMTSGGKHENRQTEVATISRQLKQLARELNCAVLALSQLNRTIEQRGEREPQLSDLRESGALEQDADVVAFIYEEKREANAPLNQSRRLTLKVAKNRSGQVGRGQLDFLPMFTSFEEPPPMSQPRSRRHSR